MYKKWLSLALALLGFLLAPSPNKAEQIAGGLTYQPKLRLGKGAVYSAAWRPDGKAVAVTGSAGIWLYTDTFKEITYLDAYLVGPVQWSPDGRLIAAVAKGSSSDNYTDLTLDQYASVGAILIWDAATYRLLDTF